MAVQTIEEFEERLRSLGGGELAKQILSAMTLTMLNAEGNAKRNATTRPRVRTGRLRSSIAGSAAITGGNIEGRLEAGGHSRKKHLGQNDSPSGGHGEVPYARFQEEGGHPRAPSGKKLRIPFPGGPALTGAGVDRYPSPLRSTGGGRFFLVVTDDGAYLHNRDTPDAGPWYVLVSSTKEPIPGKRYLGRAMDKAKTELPSFITPAVRSAILGEVK